MNLSDNCISKYYLKQGRNISVLSERAIYYIYRYILIHKCKYYMSGVNIISMIDYICIGAKGE